MANHRDMLRIHAAGFFLGGVMVTLTLIGLATLDVWKAERDIGRCEGACVARGYPLAVQNKDGCSCSLIGTVGTVQIDPRGTPIRCKHF